MEVVFEEHVLPFLAVHGAVHPTCSVVGVLLAAESAIEASKIKVCGAIPLFHTPSSRPIAEGSLKLVDSWARGKEPALGVVGVYYVESGGEPVEESAAALASSLRVGLPHGVSPLLVRIDDSFGIHGDDPVRVSGVQPSGSIKKIDRVAGYDVKQMHDVLRRFVTGDSSKQTDATAAVIASTLFSDMDSYLDDPSKDWTNESLVSSIQDFLKTTA